MSLKDERLRCGLTQEQVAEEFGITASAVSRWESGEMKPRADKLLRLAELYGCSVETLLRGEHNDDT